MADTTNYSRHYRQRLRAEVLLDAVTDVTGVPRAFAAMPAGSRAKQMWTHRVESMFLDTFGRPDPNQDPPCERTSDTTVTQALHLMNAAELQRKMTSDDGRAAQLAASDCRRTKIVEELYLVAYARLPDAERTRSGAPRVRPRPSRRRQRSKICCGRCSTRRSFSLDRGSRRRHDDCRNCEGITPPRLPQLGLGALLGGGLIDVLRAAAQAPRRTCRAGRRQLHPDLDGRRADALRNVRPQAGRAGRNPRRVRGDRDEAARRAFLAAHDAAGALATSSPSSARSATTRATTAPATTT